MDLYFSPLACSLATRIAIYEAKADADFHRVDTRAGRTADGADYTRINPKGLVPALKTDEGEVLTENAAILQYIADRYPKAGLAPDGFERYRLQQWLSSPSRGSPTSTSTWRAANTCWTASASPTATWPPC